MRSDQSQGQVSHPALNNKKQCACVRVYACVVGKLVEKKSTNSYISAPFSLQMIHATLDKPP